MKRTTAALVILLALAPAAPGQRARAGGARAADSGEEVERLLERYVLAQGGAELFKLRTRIVRGRVEVSGSPVPGSFESYEKAPNKEISIITGPAGQFIAATDGVSRWRQAPWGGSVTTVGFGGGDELVREAGKGRGGFRWRNAFTASRLRGRARVDGREMIVLAATPKGREPVLMYFDAETYLLRKQEPDRAAGAGKVSLAWAVYIDRYATVEGIKVPALFRMVTDQFTMTFRVTEVKHNVLIDDALFRSPGGK